MAIRSDNNNIRAGHNGYNYTRVSLCVCVCSRWIFRFYYYSLFFSCYANNVYSFLFDTPSATADFLFSGARVIYQYSQLQVMNTRAVHSCVHYKYASSCRWLSYVYWLFPSRNKRVGFEVVVDVYHRSYYEKKYIVKILDLDVSSPSSPITYDLTTGTCVCRTLRIYIYMYAYTYVHIYCIICIRERPRHQSSRLIDSIIIKYDTFNRTGFGY